ncbi:MAG: T9SS type A sorting domain-containing protein [Bacteroidia bacterium]
MQNFKCRVALVLLLVTCAVAVHAQQWKTDLLIGKNVGFNGPVRAMVKKGDTLFVGGDFTKALDERPNAWYIDSLGEGVQNFPFFDGSVTAACSDGYGGFYAAGNFSKVNGIAKTGFVHIDSSLSIVNDFANIDLSFNNWGSTVNKMQVYDNKLFIGGNFTDKGSFSKNGLLAINPANNSVYTHFPTTAGGGVNRIIRDGSGGWFIGGSFTSVGDSVRNGIARINSDGSISGWKADMNQGAQIWSILANGNRLYISGIFSLVNGAPRSGIASLDRNNGSLMTWYPQLRRDSMIDTIGRVYDMLLTGNEIIIIGDFSHVGDSVRTCIARLDTATALVSPWKITANFLTTALVEGAVLNDKLYIGGLCDTINGQRRRNAFCLDLTSANLLSWNPDIVESTASGYIPIQNLEYNRGELVASGFFDTIGGQARRHVAKLDTLTGALNVSFDPDPDNYVTKAYATDSNLVILGAFSSVSGGLFAPAYALMDTAYMITSTLPFPNGSSLSDIDQQDTLSLMGGYFWNYGIGKNYFLAIDIPNQEVIDLDLQLNNSVNDFNFHGGKLYIGGYFTNILGSIRKTVASVNTNNWSLTSWNPGIATTSGNPYTNVISCAGAKVVVGGYFNKVGNYSRSNISLFDTLGNFSTSWNPSILFSVNATVINGTAIYIGGTSSTGSGMIKGSLTSSATTLYAGANDWIREMHKFNNKLFVSGDFYTIKGKTRSKFACFDLLTDSLLAFNPQPSGTIYTQFSIDENTIFAGGDFTNIGGGTPRDHLAAINVTTGDLLSWNPVTNGNVYALAETDNRLFAGGEFSMASGNSCSNLAEFDLAGNFTSALYQTNGRVNALATYNGRLYTGGSYTSISGQSAYNLAAINLQNNNVELFGSPITVYNATDCIKVLTVYNNTLFAGGNIKSVNGSPAGNIISYDLGSGQLNNWFPDADSTVNAIEAKNTRLYIGGSFNNVNGVQRTKLACINMQTGSLINWQPYLDVNSWWYSNDVYALKSKGDKIYVGGSFTYISGTYNQYLAEIDAFTGSKTPWNPYLENTNYWTSNAPGVYSILSDQNKLYMSGYFTKIDNNFGSIAKNRSCIAAITDTSFQSVPMCLTTVDSLSTHNIVLWEKPFSTDIASFKIYREDSLTANYQLIATIPYDSLSEYHDMDTLMSDPNATSHKYKIAALNTSGMESNLSDFHSTIHLTLNGSGQLTWTLYEIENLPNPVNFYRVYRDDLSNGNWQPINTSIPGGNSSFTDVNYSLFPNASYYVDINWAITCTPTARPGGENELFSSVTKSRSNIKNNRIMGVENKPGSGNLQVYPNPASSFITVIADAKVDKAMLSIENMLGQKVQSQAWDKSNSGQQIDISQLNKGVYFLRLESEKANAVKKIIVE